MTLNGFLCADVPLRTYTLTHFWQIVGLWQPVFLVLLGIVVISLKTFIQSIIV